jgi:hypothetical protein
MIIYIKLPDNKKHPLDVDEKISISKLKNLISDTLHINILGQRLLYSGSPLTDEHCLYEYNITDNSIIHLLYQIY